MKSNSKNRCQDKALLRLEISNETDRDSTNKDVINNDVKDYVIRGTDSELQSNKTETLVDGGKIVSDAKLSSELSMLPDVVDCKGSYFQMLFRLFSMLLSLHASLLLIWLV